MKGDSGSASIYALAMAALLAMLSVPVAVIATGYAAHRQAVLVADLAALGGANASLHDELLACTTAARVATANDGRLQSCHLTGGALTVEVSVGPPLRLLPVITASSRAGVGPASSG